MKTRKPGVTGDVSEGNQLAGQILKVEWNHLSLRLSMSEQFAR
jgi:hypothetical protein